LARTGDRNLNAILEAVTHFETRPIMGQRYIPEIREGDKRLIVLNGEPLGGTLRVPRDDENRGNIHVGGNCVKAPVTARDREICRMLRPRLERDGLYFVGLDIIGNYMTEVNVTSPTGIQEINRLDGVVLESAVLDAVERRSKAQGGR
jgi:glutathione synthase